MLLLAIDSLTLSTLSIAEADTIVTDRSRPVERESRRRVGTDRPIFTGSAARPGMWDCYVKCPTDAANDAVLAILDGDDDTERRLLFDRGGAEVVGWAIAQRVERVGSRDLHILFEPTDPLVTDAVATTTSKTFASALDQAVLVTVPGNRRTTPTIRLQPTAQRAAPTAAVGWKWRTRWTITNNASESLYRYPVRLSLGDTTPLTTTKAQADGDDLRVWIGGKEVARTLDDWDTAASFVWFLIPALPPGENLVVDVVYGNASATSPPVLAYPDLPPFDLTASSNAQWVYLVSTIAANAGKGGWYLSSGTANPTTDQEVPGAWRNILTFENPDNTDDCNNRKATVYTDAGTKYIGIFNATRARGGAMDLLDEGLADGVTIHNPLGISSVEAEIVYENDAMAGSGSNPIGKFVILTRDSGAEVWNVLFSDNSTDNSPTTIATATYTPAAPVKHLAFAVWPYDTDEMGEVNQKAKNGRKINAQWDDVLNLNINSAALSISQTETEVEIYELATELRVGGHGSGAADPPYRVVRIGNALSASGAGTPRASCKINEFVVVDGERRRASVWNSGLTAEVEPVPAPAVLAWDGRDDDGDTNEYPATDWIELRPAANPVSNPDFGSAVTPWTVGNVAAGVTVSALSVSGGKLQIAVSGNTAAGGTAIFTLVPGDRIPVNGRERVQLAAEVSTDDANVRPRLAIFWYNAAGAFLSASTESDYTVATGTYRRAFSASPPVGAATFDVGLWPKNVGASPGTSNHTLDAVRVDGEDILLTDVAMGTVDAEIDVAGRYVP